MTEIWYYSRVSIEENNVYHYNKLGTAPHSRGGQEEKGGVDRSICGISSN